MMGYKAWDLTELRTMWDRNRLAVREAKRGIDTTGMTRPRRDPAERRFLEERGPGPFTETDTPSAYPRKREGAVLPSRPVYRYRDFPGVFWEMQPDAIIDVTVPAVVARILNTERVDIIRTLIPLSDLADRLDELPLMDHQRDFWRMVLAG